MRYLFITLLIFSNICFANEKAVQLVMNSYLKAIASQNLPALKKITTKKYFDSLVENNVLRKSKAKIKEQYSFDLKIKEAAITKDRLFVGIKDKSNDNYSHYWYVLDKKDDQYIISELRMIEE